jgi:hypothetical protein
VAIAAKVAALVICHEMGAPLSMPKNSTIGAEPSAASHAASFAHLNWLP